MMNFPDINNTEKTLEYLSSAYGISSDEQVFSNVLKPVLDRLCDSTSIDKNGNLTGYINGSSNKTIMFEAHMDRIGLTVTNICDDGTLSFTNLGGVDERILPYAEVIVCGKDMIDGFIQPLNDKKSFKIEDFCIRTERKDVKELVSVGDKVVLSTEFVKLCGTVVSGAAFDNRAGILAILKAISGIKNNKYNKYNIVVLFSTQEELGLHGAYKYESKPDACVVIDVTHGETRDTKGETGVFPLGAGAVICKGPSLDFNLANQLVSICKDNNIPYDIETATGSSGTTAWVFQTKDIPSMLVSIPLKYMHTNLETLDLSDIESVSKLLNIIAEGGIKV